MNFSSILGTLSETEEIVDVHAVTSVIKSFLRELAVPLVPYEYYDKLTLIWKHHNHSHQPHESPKGEVPEWHLEVLNSIKETLAFFSSENRSMWIWFLGLAQELMKYSNKNMMNEMNLAIVLAPNIFRRPTEDASLSTIVGDSQVIVELQAFMFHHAKELITALEELQSHEISFSNRTSHDSTDVLLHKSSK